MHSAHSILACDRWWRTGPCRIPDTQKAVKGAWVQNLHTRCFHFLCSWRPSPLMGNHHQTVKSNTPSNKTLGELVLGSFWDLVTREGAAERQAHLPERTLSCTRSRCYAFSCLHLGGCIWFACERRVRVVSRCVGKLHNRLWRRLYTTGIALGKMTSFTQSTVYHQSSLVLKLGWMLDSSKCLVAGPFKSKDRHLKSLGRSTGSVSPALFTQPVRPFSPPVRRKSESRTNRETASRLTRLCGSGCLVSFQPSHTLVTTEATVPRLCCMNGRFLVSRTQQSGKQEISLLEGIWETHAVGESSRAVGLVQTAVRAAPELNVGPPQEQYSCAFSGSTNCAVFLQEDTQK